MRLDNVGIVVEDLRAAIAFFVELGLELEGEMTVEEQWVEGSAMHDYVRSGCPQCGHVRGCRKAQTKETATTASTVAHTIAVDRTMANGKLIRTSSGLP